VLSATGEAFTHAMSYGLLVGAGCAAFAAVLALRFLPAHESHDEAKPDLIEPFVQDQAA
jgi:hypothetical protein